MTFPATKPMTDELQYALKLSISKNSILSEKSMIEREGIAR
jgi:hypothetical protein